MKKVIIIGKSKCSIGAYSEKYLKQASCPVYVEDKPDSVTFEWDDTLKAPDGTPLEYLCPRPMDRIMDTITEIVKTDNPDAIRKRLSNMKSGETLGYDCDTGEFGCDFCPIVNEPLYDAREWKVAINETDAVTAFRKVKEASEFGMHMAACLGDRFITMDDIGNGDEFIRLTTEEVLSDRWRVLELTDDVKKEEEKFRTLYIRNLLKKTNFFGIKYSVIDDMSMDDMWEKMCGHRFSDEMKFEILKFILER